MNVLLITCSSTTILDNQNFTTMKIRIYILFALMAVFGLSSCDKTKGQIEEKVKVFAEALRTNDVANIYDFYPDAKLLCNMKLPNGIQMADMDVAKDDVIHVVNMNGLTVYMGTKHEIDLDAEGVYIIKVKGKALKFRVK